jgi:hypothetical protein
LGYTSNRRANEQAGQNPKPVSLLTSEDFTAHYVLHDITNLEGKRVKVLTPLPTAHEILETGPKILEAYMKTGSIEEALRVACYLTPKQSSE